MKYAKHLGRVVSAIRPLVEMSAVKMKGHTFTEDDKIVTYKEQIKVVAASGNNKKKKPSIINTVLYLWTVMSESLI